jgi:hypothetical protein
MASKLICDICDKEIVPEKISDRPVGSFVLVSLKTQKASKSDLCQDCAQVLSEAAKELKKSKNYD